MAPDTPNPQIGTCKCGEPIMEADAFCSKCALTPQTPKLQAVGGIDSLAPFGWKRIFNEECHNCGSNNIIVGDVEHLPEDYIQDGEPAKCNECGNAGTCSADDSGAWIMWESQPD